MDTFPAQYSTLSSKALLVFIANAYNLKITQCKYHLRGVSDTYIINAAQGKYIFKIYRSNHHSFEEISGEVELLSILKAGGISVAYPVNDIAGKFIQEFNAVEGERFGILFIFAPGVNKGILSETELNTFGTDLARIHNITSGLELHNPRIVYDLETTLTKPLKVLEPAFADFEEGHAWLCETAERVKTKIGAFATEKFSYGYCHYDMLPKNFHFDDAGQITFFDFDWAGKGYLVNDMATFFFQYYLLANYKKVSIDEAASAFSTVVTSYRKVRELSEEEVLAIPFLWFNFMVYGTAFQYQNFDDMSNHYFSTRYLKERIEMMKQLVETHCRF